MGGRAWRPEEERIFWREIARIAPPGLDERSKKAKGQSVNEKNWGPLAALMKRRIKEDFPDLAGFRNYTSNVCYEHYFQNYHKGFCSPNARNYVNEYITWLENRAARVGNSAPQVSRNTVAARQRGSKAVRRQQVAQRRMTQSPAAPHVADETQTAFKTPIGPVIESNQMIAPSMPAANQAAHPVTQSFSAHHAMLRSLQYRQATPARKTPSYFSGTGNQHEASEGFNRPMSAHSTTQDDYDDEGFDGSMSAPRGYGGSNGLYRQVTDYNHARSGPGRGYLAETNNSYGYGGQIYTNEGQHFTRGVAPAYEQSFTDDSAIHAPFGQHFNNGSATRAFDQGPNNGRTIDVYDQHFNNDNATRAFGQGPNNGRTTDVYDQHSNNANATRVSGQHSNNASVNRAYGQHSVDRADLPRIHPFVYESLKGAEEKSKNDGGNATPVYGQPYAYRAGRPRIHPLVYEALIRAQEKSENNGGNARVSEESSVDPANIPLPPLVYEAFERHSEQHSMNGGNAHAYEEPSVNRAITRAYGQIYNNGGTARVHDEPSANRSITRAYGQIFNNGGIARAYDEPSVNRAITHVHGKLMNAVATSAGTEQLFNNGGIAFGPGHQTLDNGGNATGPGHQSLNNGGTAADPGQSLDNGDFRSRFQFISEQGDDESVVDDSDDGGSDVDNIDETSPL